MQGKGIVRLFLVLMTLVTILQYIFYLPSRKVEKAAEAYALAASATAPEATKDDLFKQKRASYLDSMSTEPVFKIPLVKSYTYQELKAQQLALGLDLKGGMSVVLQVDLREFIRALANNSKDPTFTKALDNAVLAQQSAQSDFVTLFVNEFQKLSGNAGEKLAPIFSRNEALRDRIDFSTSDADVAQIIREKANETVDLTFKMLKERIDKLGVTQPNVSLDAARDLIVVELPGIDNPERARTFLQAAAKLDFWNVYRITDPGIQEGFIQANSTLATILGVDDKTMSTTYDTTYVVDSLTQKIDSSKIARIDTLTLPNANINQGPLFEVFTLNAGGTRGLAVMGTAKKNQRSRIDSLLNRPEIKELFNPDIAFVWSKDPAQDYETRKELDAYELYAIKKENGEKPPLSGDLVTDANANPDPRTNKVGVSLRMNNIGTTIWANMTSAASADNNREIAILLDGEVVSAPGVINPIMDGNSSITGNFTVQEAKDLASILQIGKLPAETRSVQESVVGPSLGQSNINKSLISMVVGFALILVFMIFYYGGGGIVSILSLFLNLFFIFGALASMGTVLTLPGIAGIVLTMGMAVDANVIIFERIREELREGKNLLSAISDGYKHSYSAIIDSNVTTFLVAVVLAYFGLGPIKGFAVVLMVGVVSSFFTAVFVSKLIIDWWTQKGRKISFSTPPTRDAFTKLNVDWMGLRKYSYFFSGLIILAGIVSFVVRGFDLGVDFKGGYSYNVTFDQSVQVDADKIRTTLAVPFTKAPVVKAVDAANTFNIVTDYRVNDESEKAAEEVLGKLFEGVNTIAGGKLTLDKFQNINGDGTHLTSSSKVGATIADDIKNSAFQAGFFALLLIFLYILIRFSKWQYSTGGIVALFHDVLITLSFFSIFYGILPFSMEIDQAFVAAILTVIGYSINDTVIVFDRIREFLGLYSKGTKNEILNRSINTTMSRTVITSATTIFTVVVLLLFGGDSIKGFAFALVVGIVAGTYSSIFIATPIMNDLSPNLKMKEEEKKTGGSVKPTFSKAAAKAR